MEVTTVSSSPASPTEGDNVCETDVTSVAMHSVSLPICLCRLAGNGAVLCFLDFRCSSRNTTTHYILILTFLNFLCLLVLLPSSLLFLLEDMSCSIILPLQYMVMLFQMLPVSYSMWLYMLAYTNIRSCSSIHCPLWHCCHCPQHLSWLVLALLWAFFALFTVLPTVTSLCPSEEQGHCQAALISMYTIILLLFVAPMVISSTIDFIKAKWGSQQQQPKRRDIVIVLIVLLTLLLIICDFLQQLGYLNVPSLVFSLFPCINSSIKPFIYFLVGRCWRPCSVGSLRLSLQRVFEEQKEKSGNTNDPTMDTMI
uniref:mas-related G-protein coupled receptor member H n=1 Tax=Lonchura striata TaxID=40157 RepID=UPI0012935C48|nr:mas-related G-protein coupled receptor member H [Lonchura striata domestica]